MARARIRSPDRRLVNEIPAPGNPITGLDQSAAKHVFFVAAAIARILNLATTFGLRDRGRIQHELSSRRPNGAA